MKLKHAAILVAAAVWAYAPKDGGKGYVVTKDGKPQFETTTIAQANRYVEELNREESGTGKYHKRGNMNIQGKPPKKKKK